MGLSVAQLMISLRSLELERSITTGVFATVRNTWSQFVEMQIKWGSSDEHFNFFLPDPQKHHVSILISKFLSTICIRFAVCLSIITGCQNDDGPIDRNDADSKRGNNKINCNIWITERLLRNNVQLETRNPELHYSHHIMDFDESIQCNRQHLTCIWC